MIYKLMIAVFDWIKKPQNCPSEFILPRKPLNGSLDISVKINDCITQQWSMLDDNKLKLHFRPNKYDKVMVKIRFHHNGESCSAIENYNFYPREQS